MTGIAYRTVDVDGLTVFYREAGASDAPTLVLLHGFPSASHMFRELIPLLAASAAAAMSGACSASARRFVGPLQQGAEQPTGTHSRREVGIPEDRGEHDRDDHRNHGGHQGDHNDRWGRCTGPRRSGGGRRSRGGSIVEDGYAYAG